MKIISKIFLFHRKEIIMKCKKLIYQIKYSSPYWPVQTLLLIENRLFMMANKIAIYNAQSQYQSNKSEDLVIINTSK